ncbi:MAG: tetratricopeptide repeat protein [Syntrophomonadaceae bacterium]|jgi:tetratricopeptide (TPR) repeat protein
MQENDIMQVENIIGDALVKIRNHKISSALEELLKAVEIEPENEKIINLIASCYYIKGEFDQAISCWKMVLRLDEKNQEASTQLENVNTPAFQFWLKRYRNILVYMDSRNFNQAIEGLKQLIQEKDNFVSLYELLGLGYLALSEVEKARQAWSKGLEIDQDNKSLLGYLEIRKDNEILASQQIKKTKKEIAAFSEGERFRYNKLAIAGLLCLALLIPTGFYVTYINDKTEKKPVIQNKTEHEITAKYPSGEETVPVVNNSISPVSVTEEKIVKQTSFETSDNQSEGLFYNQGLAAYREADWEQASFYLGKVVKLESGSYINREALYYLARTKYLSKELVEAEKYYLKFLKEFPNSNYYDDSLYYLGCVYHQNGEDQMAREVWTELAEFDPTSGYLSTSLYKRIMSNKESNM